MGDSQVKINRQVTLFALTTIIFAVVYGKKVEKLEKEVEKLKLQKGE